MKSAVSSAVTGTASSRRLLDIEQMTRTLAFLAGYRPAAFGTTMDGATASTAGCGAPRLRLDGRMPGTEGPEPYCTACGGLAGIFLGRGADWHHFRSAKAGLIASPAVYAADHAPVIGWRYTTPACCADTPGDHEARRDHEVPSGGILGVAAGAGGRSQ